jgi:hypothetical protein
MREETKPRIRIIGNTVYEINRRTKKIEGVFHGADKYFASHRNEDAEEEFEEEFEEEESQIPAHIKRKRLQALAQGMIGNKRKLAITTKADGLDREIAIDDTEREPEEAKKKLFRKKKSIKSKSKRKPVKKCRCKK